MLTRRLKLTRRWTPLRPHPIQSRLYHDRKRFKIVKAGRRSGKTETGKRFLTLRHWAHCPQNPQRIVTPWDDPRYFASAPTRDQAKAIFWNDLKRLMPDDWKARTYETDLCIATKWGTELWVLGLDKPERIEGRSWDGGLIDEFANIKVGALDANIRPALADRKGWLWLLGVPDKDSPNQIEYRNLCEAAESSLADEFGVYSWPSADILDAAEVESARKQLDPRVFAQEYLGQFVLDGGRAFPDFDRKVHVSDRAEYDPALPLCWTLDFNVDPFLSLVCQVAGDEVHVLDEIECHSTVTPVMVEAFFDRCRERGWPLDASLKVYGDPAGNQRKTTAAKANTTDWTLVREGLRDLGEFEFKVRRGAIPIADTRNALNTKIKNANGDVGLYIHPRCRRLPTEIDSLLWPSDLSEGHATAALRYLVEREFPVRRTATDDQYQVSVL